MKRNRVILAVDDDEKMLEMLNRIFKLEGYDIAMATDGKSALALFDEHTPDLVLLDIMMPGLDGFEVLSLIRQRSNVPVVMVTAKCDIPSLHNALVLGADDYVRKPFSACEVVSRVKAKLRRAEQ
ncbi:Transcriptional regulatory protein WalR [subsurface metagenome]